ncbi:MAG: two-component system sensor histidine kinase BarA [Pirellulaceae bacterium]|jgi:two-component system sensor histidine kinase BarA
MGYRSIKRVLGETSLERKCRILFLIFITILIALAFGWVEFNAEKWVMENTRLKGRDLASLSMMALHFQVWETGNTENQDILRETIKSLDQKGYEFEILSLEMSNTTSQTEDPWEMETLEQFRSALLERKQMSAVETIPEEAIPAVPIAEDANIIFRDRILADQGEYHYLQPVIYDKKKCSKCHPALSDTGALSASEAMSSEINIGKLQAMKVVFPYEKTRNAIASARAGLIAVAILTVFVAMIALYVIVRYVIVKPLKHLRDVTDDISRGKLEVRADLKTADEFEELASSFNRMLRHLTDSQASLREANEELDGKIDQLAQANMRLYEMNRLKGDFLANMSHELRTPLNSIIGFSEVLQGLESLNDKQKRYARNIQKSGRLLLDMINDILDLAKMEAGKMELRPTEFRIDALIQSQCDLMRTLTEEKNIDLRAEFQGEMNFMHQDQGKVQQILTNLLSNAIKFTPEGGIITCSAKHSKDDRLFLKVQDTGVGIAQEDREIIFEKFRQGNTQRGEDNLTREYSGTGLGLSIVKELCILLGGEISVESEIGKGSCFEVMLPWNCPIRPERNDELEARLNAISSQIKSDHFPSTKVTTSSDADESTRQITTAENGTGENSAAENDAKSDSDQNADAKKDSLEKGTNKDENPLSGASISEAEA